MKKTIVAVLALGAIGLAMQAGATPILELTGANGYGIGYIMPNQNPADFSDADLLNMTKVYNGAASSPIAGLTYTVESGSHSPVTAPTPISGTMTSSQNGNNGSSDVITLPTGVTYLIAHWDGSNGADAIYDVSSLGGQTVDLVNDVAGIDSSLGLSGYWFAQATPPSPSVPDGAPTVLLLGAVVTGIALIRRKIASR